MIKNIKNFLKHKKAKALLGTMLVDLVIFLVGPEWQELGVTIFTTIGGIYIGGQAFADGISGGKTSTVED